LTRECMATILAIEDLRIAQLPYFGRIQLNFGAVTAQLRSNIGLLVGSFDVPDLTAKLL
jgi:hypothetical protein